MTRPTRWGVIGLGRAGRARLRAIEARPHLTLAGAVGHREGPAAADALYDDPTIDGLVICTANAAHAAAAARALDVGKHVIVEFPLAATAAEARDLFDRARRAGRVLHTELIGQLTARHAAARALCRTEAVQTLTSRFTGRSYRWVADEIGAGRIGQLAIARLHALHDLLGPLTLDGVECTSGPGRYHLVARLTGAGGAQIVLDERRGPDLGRGSALTGHLADGRPFEPATGIEPGDLFGRDLDRALARIAGDPGAAYVSDAAVIDMLALAEQISAAAR